MTLPRISLLAYDWSLVMVVGLIHLAGLVTLRSAAPSPAVFFNQLMFSGVAVMAAVALQFLSRRQVQSWGWLLYGLSLVLLVAVLVMGREVNGARAWLDLGPVNFQPSELAKLSLILVLSRWLSRREPGRIFGYAAPLLIAAPVLGLVLIEPDLGGTTVLAVIVVSLLLTWGMPMRHFLVGLALLGIAAPFAFQHLEPYQQQRIIVGFNPESDPQGKGYQQIQSMIAIGSGGLLGKGYGQGTQSQLGYVPEKQNDFIFAVLSEEWGFVGAVSLLVLYGLLFFRLARMALECNRLEDRLIIVGVCSMIAFQVMVNIGVTIGMAPVTGLTLPLFSAGGTSLLFVYVSLGLAALVHRDRYRDL
ncbi:rod shape-determining protein RodA [Calidithermus timidus]|jgi:rod shape determining protein RodA|uniref:rod shape-determining protein RodA n=1 Tax=Calidithermus timidus TaxID=307124 RepID=UPI000367F408|nr:rod shape-determining protein RodA [Calidithermus timidus]